MFKKILIVLLLLLCLCGLVSSYTPVASYDALLRGDYIRAYYSFDQWETANVSIYNDYNGNYNLTRSGAPYQTRDNYKINESYFFDGTDDYILSAAATSWTSDDGGTVNFWANVNKSGGGYFAKSDTANNRFYGLLYSTGGKLQLQHYKADAAAYNKCTLCNSPLIVNNSWQMISVTSNGSTFKIYINGTECSAYVYDNCGGGALGGDWFGDLTAGTTNWEIMDARYGGTHQYQRGYIDEFFITNKTLNSSEILELYNRQFYANTPGAQCKNYTIGQCFNSSYGLPPDYIIISITNPANNYHTNLDYQKVYFTSTVSANCTLYVNSTLVNYTYTTNNTNTTLTMGNLVNGNYTYFINCTNGTWVGNTSNYTLVVDTIIPTITDNSNLGSSQRVETNTTFNVTIGDTYLFRAEIYANCSNGSAILFSQSNYSNGTYSSNIIRYIDNRKCGTYDRITVRIDVADMHTKNAIGEYSIIKDGSNKITFNDKLSIMPKDTTDFIDVTTFKQTDKYSFTYKPAVKLKQYMEFVVEANNLYIGKGTEHLYKGHLIRFNNFQDNNWVDFNNKQGYPVTVKEISKGIIEIKVDCSKDQCLRDIEFESVGGLNTNYLEQSYYYNNGNFSITETYADQVYEGGTFFYNATIVFNKFLYGNFTNWLVYFNRSTPSGLYNDSNYTYLITNSSTDYNTTAVFGYNITLPSSIPLTDGNLSHSWQFNIQYINGTQRIYTTPAVNQSLSGFFFDNCTIAGSSLSYNFTIYDIDNKSKRLISTFKITANYITNSGYPKNVSYDLLGSDNYSFCVTPYYADFDINFTIQYKADGYDYNSWVQYALSATNITEHVKLYLLNSSTTTDITVHVIDEDDNDLENVIVELWYDDIGTGKQILLSSDNTNNLGQVKFKVNTNNRYFFKVYRGTEILLATTPGKITDTSIELLVIGIDSSRFTTWKNIKNVTYSLTYTNSTRQLAFSYSDTNNASDKYYLNVLYTNGTIINSQYSTNKSATLYYTLADNNASYYIYASTTDFNNNEYTIDDLTIDREYLWRVIGAEGIIYTMIFYISTTLLGLEYPLISAVLGFAGILVFYMLGFTGMATPILMWCASLIGIGIFFMRKLK